MLTNRLSLVIILLQLADLAHPVERHLAKVEVASSSLVIRSNEKNHFCYQTKVVFSIKSVLGRNKSILKFITSGKHLQSQALFYSSKTVEITLGELGVE